MTAHKNGAWGRQHWMVWIALVVIIVACGCKRSGASRSADGGAPTGGRKLVLGSYTTPREAYGTAILPAFKAHWKQKTGEDLAFQESYQGSSAQARAIAEGFEADVAALSLEPDLVTLENAKLITHDWRGEKNSGIVSRSVVVIAVRPGNPKGIRDWADLAKPGVEVLTPNVRTSGGAMWNVAAIHGAALRGNAGATKGDAGAAERVLADVLSNVVVMDKGARESIVNFEKGVGDAAITYENEVLVAKLEGRKMDYVVPRSTILIENPVAVVDTYVKKHGVDDVAQAFVAFLTTPEAQRAYTKFGLRSVLESEANRNLPAVEDLFTIKDLGGWPEVHTRIFAKGAVYDRAISAVEAKGNKKK